MRFQRLTLDNVRIEDERSYRHIGLYAELKRALVRDHVTFLVPKPGTPEARWDRALFLNLTFWSPDQPGDVLDGDAIPADVVMHAGWHHVTRRALDALGPTASQSPDALLLGESIASAFDLYLVGRLLGHAPDAAFLETQVPAMAEAAQQAGMPEDAFEAMLDEVSRDPDKAFEDLRELLFDASIALVRAPSVEEAAERIARFDTHRFGPLLHHYELSTWILYARAYAKDAGAPDPQVMAVDAMIRRADVALDWLEKNWIYGLSGDPGEPDDREVLPR
ncbi:hypothetical protein [Polyangium fumosum]|uniref:Uncharacterized protein n=1 Tax=Polyangium fumosum TaxID=889272 RepID=A0A4U1JEH2_9BACT|nr:hypothetical protein [Polyangium fumosum]TKD09200.1 hypothetical protein E8A74_13055 [Polyangium fumosum]